MSIEDCPHYRGWNGSWKCTQPHCDPGLGCHIELAKAERKYQEDKRNRVQGSALDEEGCRRCRKPYKQCRCVKTL